MTISLRPRGPFSLPEPLHLAFTDDGGEAVALRAAWAAEAGEVEVDYVSDLAAERVERHAARVLSLDVDGSGLAQVGERDPVVGRLLAAAGRAAPGLLRHAVRGRSVGGALPARLDGPGGARQGRARGRAGHADGDRRRRGGRVPRPGRARLARVLPGRLGLKLERIRALAAAAVAGDLDPAHLRALDLDAAIAHLESLPGIGPFGAMLVLARGAGHPDVPPPTLRRFRAAVRSAYALDHEPDEAELAELSEAWRPYRSWVTWLLRSTGGE